MELFIVGNSGIATSEEFGKPAGEEMVLPRWVNSTPKRKPNVPQRIGEYAVTIARPSKPGRPRIKEPDARIAKIKSEGKLSPDELAIRFDAAGFPTPAKWLERTWVEAVQRKRKRRAAREAMYYHISKQKD